MALVTGIMLPYLNFEEKFEYVAFHEWMTVHWTDCFFYAIAYVGLVFGGVKYMDNRDKYDLRKPLICWSSLLAMFSILGMIRTVPELLHGLFNHGFTHSICNPSYLFDSPTSFWCAAFTVSKVVELWDTAFIIFRKQQLSFLHWFHHATVMMYCWYTYVEVNAAGRWFMVMNYVVHSIMYTYYALKAARVHVPKWVNIVITSLQITQMMMGIFINTKSYLLRSNGYECHQTYENMFYAMLMYIAYFVLFAHFFYVTYLSKPKSKTVLSENCGSHSKTKSE